MSAAWASDARLRRSFSSSGRAAEKRSSVEGLLRDLSELKIGDPVVHLQHGIGRYHGLVSLDLGDGANEFLQLEYDGADKLYVPVSQLAVISRYSGVEADAAPLHKLGSGQWDKAKARAAKQVRDTAAELLALYAKRALRQGHAFAIRQHDLHPKDMVGCNPVGEAMGAAGILGHIPADGAGLLA